MARIKYLPYNEAKKVVSALNFTSSTDFLAACSLGERPLGVHGSPNVYYKGKGWKGWKDFLGIEEEKYAIFDEAHKTAMTLGLKTSKEYERWYKANEDHKALPPKPDRYYKDSGWNGWPYFLTGIPKQAYVSYEEASAFARDKGVKTQVEWLRLCGRGERPANIPSSPATHYSKTGEWCGWPEFLGVKRNKKPNRRGFTIFPL